MKLSNPTGRSTEEWVATHPDQAIPDRVKLRIWSRCDGKCYLSGVRITPGMPRQYDHIVALCNGGEHRESNIALVWGDAHKKKTAEDRKAKAKSDRIRKKFFGIKKPSKFAGSRNSKWKKKIDGSVVLR